MISPLRFRPVSAPAQFAARQKIAMEWYEAPMRGATGETVVGELRIGQRRFRVESSLQQVSCNDQPIDVAYCLSGGDNQYYMTPDLAQVYKTFLFGREGYTMQGEDVSPVVRDISDGRLAQAFRTGLSTPRKQPRKRKKPE